jgi:hypothetical protein
MLYVTLVEKSIFRFLTHTFQGPALCSKSYHVTLIAKLERSSANFVEHIKKKENPFVSLSV